MPGDMVESDLIAVSGAFDPCHIGHLRMIYDASNFGKVLILLNSDEWLMRKKGFVFMPWQERRELLIHYRFVHGVVAAQDDDDTVCESIKQLSSVLSYFGNGGDRTIANTPEIDLCKGLGIKTIFGLGGNKVQSSSKLVGRVKAG